MKLFKKIRIYLFGMNESDLAEYNNIAKTYLKESLQYILDNTLCPGIGIASHEPSQNKIPSDCPLVKAMIKALLYDVPQRFDLMIRHESAEVAVEELFEIIYDIIKSYELNHCHDCSESQSHGLQICNNAKDVTFQKLRATKIA